MRTLANLRARLMCVKKDNFFLLSSSCFFRVSSEFWVSCYNFFRGVSRAAIGRARSSLRSVPSTTVVSGRPNGSKYTRPLERARWSNASGPHGECKERPESGESGRDGERERETSSDIAAGVSCCCCDLQFPRSDFEIMLLQVAAVLCCQPVFISCNCCCCCCYNLCCCCCCNSCCCCCCWWLMQLLLLLPKCFCCCNACCF